MAELNLNAADITASIQKSKLKFSADGLSIYNGGIKIFPSEESDNPSFYVDNGNLVLKGRVEANSGFFTGTINAESGSFSGVISANAGDLGGFIIKEGQLTSKAGEGSVVLDGLNGKIIAKSIELGTGAIIQDYIQIGNAKLQNPNIDKNRPFIEAGSLQIFDNGIINLGDIELNGPESTINGKNFEITPEFASFSNINCSGTIQTVVFEKSKVQSVGGSMIFKPCYKVKEVIEKEGQNNQVGFVLELEEELEFNSGYIWLITKEGTYSKKIEISSTTTDTVFITGTISEYNDIGQIIYIGNKGSLVIGMNSENTGIGQHVLPKGLTMQSFIPEANENVKNPELFLGDLTSIDKTGYGLYCSNVYLKGSITTGTKDSKYAGINTNSNVESSHFKIPNTENGEIIIIWAGAKNEETIYAAPFYVTESGSFYASKGQISDTLFVGGVISGATIKAATIYGTGDDPSLTLYDATKGISFKTESENKEIFSINASGLKALDKNFIDISTEITFNADRYNGNEFITKENLILTNSILKKDNRQISFNEENLIKFDLNGSSKLYVKNDSVEILNQKLFVENNFDLGGKMEYKNTENGYDLYITN